MNLRTRILAYVVAIMGIVFIMVLAALLPDTVRNAERSIAQGNATVNVLQAVLENLTRAQRHDLMASHPQLFREELDGWVLIGPNYEIDVWAMPGPRPARTSERQLLEQRFEVKNTVITRDHERLVLYARFADLKAPPVDLWLIFLVMTAGTILLASVIYGLLLRMVVKPVERLAAASRSPAIARGLLAPVPHTERRDEVGDLIRAYNKMVTEMNDLRLNLEKRVTEATRSLEDAQKQIVLSERLSAAGRVAAGVAHEINNPLGGMLNAARTLKSKFESAAPGARESEYLDLILDGLARIQNIVATLLQFSRPAQNPASLDLAEVIEGALLFCRHRLTKLGVNVEKEYQPAVPRVVGMRSELGQVFLNLFVNALDAMEAAAGQHVLKIKLAVDGANVIASVQDSGHGMSPEVQERAGQFFFSTKREGPGGMSGGTGGTGLGLAIVQHIMTQHRGTMKIESKEGQGTTVMLVFPAELESRGP